MTELINAITRSGAYKVSEARRGGGPADGFVEALHNKEATGTEQQTVDPRLPSSGGRDGVFSRRQPSTGRGVQDDDGAPGRTRSETAAGQARADQARPDTAPGQARADQVRSEQPRGAQARVEQRAAGGSVGTDAGAGATEDPATDADLDQATDAAGDEAPVQGDGRTAQQRFALFTERSAWRNALARSAGMVDGDPSATLDALMGEAAVPTAPTATAPQVGTAPTEPDATGAGVVQDQSIASAMAAVAAGLAAAPHDFGGSDGSATDGEQSGVGAASTGAPAVAAPGAQTAASAPIGNPGLDVARQAAPSSAAPITPTAAAAGSPGLQVSSATGQAVPAASVSGSSDAPAVPATPAGTAFDAAVADAAQSASGGGPIPTGAPVPEPGLRSAGAPSASILGALTAEGTASATAAPAPQAATWGVSDAASSQVATPSAAASPTGGSAPAGVPLSQLRDVAAANSADALAQATPVPVDAAAALTASRLAGRLLDDAVDVGGTVPTATPPAGPQVPASAAPSATAAGATDIDGMPSITPGDPEVVPAATAGAAPVGENDAAAVEVAAQRREFARAEWARQDVNTPTTGATDGPEAATFHAAVTEAGPRDDARPADWPGEGRGADVRAEQPSSTPNTVGGTDAETGRGDSSSAQQQPPTTVTAPRPEVMTGVERGFTAPQPMSAAATSSAAPAGSTPGTPPPHLQILRGVGPLLDGGDGLRQITLQLAPAHLGKVSVTLEMRGTEVSIVMQAADGTARDVLKSGLDDLRGQLADMGLRAGHVDVNSGGHSDGGRPTWADVRQQAEAARRAATRTGTGFALDPTPDSPATPATQG